MVFSTGFFIIAGNHPKSFKTIVKETKVQIDNLKKNFDQKEELLHIEEKYLNHLHLTEPIFYPNSSWIRFVLTCYFLRNVFIFNCRFL